MSDIFEVTISKPPSANVIWRHVGQKVLKSRDYRQWLSDQSAVVWMAYNARPTITGSCEVHITYQPQDGRYLDLDNILKPVLDLLEAAGVFENDRLVEVIHLRRLPPRKNTNTLKVVVIPIAPHNQPGDPQ